jgi:hypothetical protein
VEIFLNFVGKLNIPSLEETEREPLDPAERKREKLRLYYRRRRARIRAEKEKAAQLASARREKIQTEDE